MMQLRLWRQPEGLMMWKATADRCLRGKKKVQRVLVKELQSRMVNAVQ